MEAEMVDIEDMFQLGDFMNNCLEAVIIFNAAGIILDCSQSIKEETGFFDELIGKNIAELYPKVFELKAGYIYTDKGNTKNKSWNEVFAYRKNHTCFPVSLKVIFKQTANGLYGCCFAENISERIEAVKSKETAMIELDEATKLKSEFVANITHELRTPVNGMKGLAYNLMDTQLKQRQLETVNIIIRCCNNMTEIINDLLDFSKIEAGKLTLEKREFDFKKFMDDTMAFNIGRINEKGLKLILNIGVDVPNWIIGDELRLGQIINNFFSNAIKFTSVGHIAFEIISTFQNDSEIELFFMVTDTGIGIAKDDMDKLFRSFSQVDGSITRRFGGTGLGLSICRQLVELMGGTIHVDSETDKGSTFSFSAKFERVKGKEKDENSRYPEGRFIYDRNYGKSDDSMDLLRLIPISEALIEDKDQNLRKVIENLEKLVICIEMGNWEKAENFAAVIKRLMPEDQQELRRSAFKLELTVRKEDYEKSFELVKQLQELLQNKEDLV